MGAAVSWSPAATAGGSDDGTDGAEASTTWDWLIAPEDGKPGCHVTLGTEATIGGNVITLSPECASQVESSCTLETLPSI